MLAEDVERLRAVVGRIEAARAVGGRLQPVRRHAAAGAQREEGRLHGRADGRPRARPRSGRRSSTRSGGATATSSTWRTCTATTGRRCASSTSLAAARRPPLRPELRDQRDDLRADRPARLHRGRRLRDAAAAARGAARRALRARQGGGPLPDRARSSRARTRRTIYRSPLTEIGVDVKVGDYVLAIDGEELTRRRRSLPPAPRQGRPAGAADGEREARPWRARAR